MIEVELPDGTIAEFPNGTSQDVMKGALQRRFGAPKKDISQVDGPDPNEIVKRGSILPFGRERDGDITLALPEFLEGPKRAVMDLLDGKRTASEITGKEIFELGTLFAGGAGGAGRTAARAGESTSKIVQKLTKKSDGVQVPKEGQLVAEAANRSGVELPRAVTSDNTVVQQTGKLVANIPVSGVPLRKASETAIKQLDDAAAGIQGSLGSGDIKAAGQSVREALTGFITEDTARRVTAKYNRVDSMVDPNVSSPLKATAKLINEITAGRNNAALGESAAARTVSEALSRPDGLNYVGVKELRTSVRELLDKPNVLPANVSQAELKRVHSALTSDLKSIVGKAGGEKAAKAFSEANSFAARVAGQREKLSKLLKAQSDEAIFDRIVSTASTTSKADRSLLGQVKRSVDARTWDEIGSGIIARLGRDTEGKFSPDRFVTGWGKLSEAGKGILFGGKPGLRQALNDIATVSSRFKHLNQFANPSGTAQSAIGASSLTGFFIDPVSIISSALSARVLASILAKPRTAKPVASWAKSYLRHASKPTKATAKALSSQTRILSARVAADLGVPDMAKRIFLEIQGASKSGADGDQND